jgi:hypothetical protein
VNFYIVSDNVVGSGKKRYCVSFILWLAAIVLNYTKFYDSGDLPLHVWGFLFYMSYGDVCRFL